MFSGFSSTVLLIILLFLTIFAQIFIIVYKNIIARRACINQPYNIDKEIFKSYN